MGKTLRANLVSAIGTAVIFAVVALATGGSVGFAISFAVVIGVAVFALSADARKVFGTKGRS